MSEYSKDLLERKEFWQESVNNNRRNLKISMGIFVAGVAWSAVGVVELVRGDTEGGIAAVAVGGLLGAGFGCDTLEDIKSFADSTARLAVTNELIAQAEAESLCGKTP